MIVIMSVQRFMLSYATEKLRTRLQKVAFDTAVTKVSIVSRELIKKNQKINVNLNFSKLVYLKKNTAVFSCLSTPFLKFQG